MVGKAVHIPVDAGIGGNGYSFIILVVEPLLQIDNFQGVEAFGFSFCIDKSP
jgi:hypothetical protein